MRAPAWVLLLFAAVTILLQFQDKQWKPLEVFDFDPGGYYAPLPSAFIFHDFARADSLLALKHAYKPEGSMDIGLVHLPTGGYITKYPLGVALVDLPWFWGAHLYAGAAGYPQDGFARPYQQSIMLAGLVHALLGMVVLARLLRRYFPDPTAAWTLAAIGLGTNLLCYASYEAGMAHAPLFLWQAALLTCTARWHETGKEPWGLGVGLFLGLAVLTRPTEILYGLVPLLWGLTGASGTWAARPAWLWQQRKTIARAALLFGLVVSVQLLFWHSVSGQWVIYTYGNERFVFSQPHLIDGLFSFKKGWLLYTPLAALALLGIGPLRRRLPQAWLPVLLTVLVVVYVTFSWEQWWYGGGFSARPLISLYPLLALALAALLDRSASSLAYGTLRALLLIGILLNVWQTWQYSAGVIHWDSNTSERYFSYFFRLKP